MEWLMANWKDVLLIITSVVTAASVVTKFTKNVWDDKVVNAILRVLAMIPGLPK